MTTINDLTSYNANMIKGMADKLWFVNHLSKDDRYLFVDFGCADGTLIYILSQMREFPNGCEFIGYDISEEMVGLAKTKYDWGTNNNVSFYSNQEELYKGITAKAPTASKRVLILSSVIHEIYSYGTREDEAKDLPKWKTTIYVYKNPEVPKIETKCGPSYQLHYKGLWIDVDELFKKLPKE